MSRGIRKTGIFIAVMLTVVVLTGCQTPYTRVGKRPIVVMLS